MNFYTRFMTAGKSQPLCFSTHTLGQENNHFNPVLPILTTNSLGTEIICLHDTKCNGALMSVGFQVQLRGYNTNHIGSQKYKNNQLLWTTPAFVVVAATKATAQEGLLQTELLMHKSFGNYRGGKHLRLQKSFMIHIHENSLNMFAY